MLRNNIGVSQVDPALLMHAHAGSIPVNNIKYQQHELLMCDN
jgi:hypothetical protein